VLFHIVVLAIANCLVKCSDLVGEIGSGNQITGSLCITQTPERLKSQPLDRKLRETTTKITERLGDLAKSFSVSSGDL
jgi:hypothetical protein